MTSSRAKTNDAAGGLALRLPETAFTRSGIAFRPNEDIWDWTDGPFSIYLDFRKVKLSTTVPCESLKHTLLVFAKQNSPSHLTHTREHLLDLFDSWADENRSLFAYDDGYRTIALSATQTATEIP